MIKREGAMLGLVLFRTGAPREPETYLDGFIAELSICITSSPRVSFSVFIIFDVNVFSIFLYLFHVAFSIC